ncbi:MAG: hypothetical protein A2Z12_07400 [Actinobacteria bacterium RBG_16_68_21]|nr:MAG: hypothetical protein A2Z12_07400 [Actinobacteria bacterium RBG_16_68_21]
MSRPESGAYRYTAFLVALWAVILPALLLRTDHGFVVAWRPWPFVAAATVLLVAATAAVLYPARRLAAAGARMMGTRPGPRLVTDGVYGRVRNPIDIAATVIAFTPWIALRLELGWIVPVAAVVHYTVGIGLYEDRRLTEAFGDEFKEYRRLVRKWVPRPTPPPPGSPAPG